MSLRRDSADVCVVGQGVVGTSLALMLAAQGLEVAWVVRGATAGAGGAPPSPDIRAYALNAASMRCLQALKVWDALPAGSVTPVRDMRIRGDAAGSLLEFSAWRLRVGELAHIVAAAALEERLHDAARFAPRLHRVAAPEPAPLTAHCEGRSSIAPAQHQVAVDRQAYGHSAVATRLVGAEHHQGLAHQWFRSPDVLALLPTDQPQPGHSWAVVWSAPQEQAAAMLSEPVASFEARLQAATRGEVGALSLAGERAAWPLTVAHAERWCGPGWVLLGDAAHQVHPLAGQGLNLGLADVVELGRVLAVRETWRSLGDERLLRRYERARWAPARTMERVTDGLWQLFAAEDPLLRGLRNRGLQLVNRVGLAKAWLATRAVQP
jgi:2-polyprenyl-6-methoxyphenol hydroxylase-like FAD-dependent oxidoreductase